MTDKPSTPIEAQAKAAGHWVAYKHEASGHCDGMSDLYNGNHFVGVIGCEDGDSIVAALNAADRALPASVCTCPAGWHDPNCPVHPMTFERHAPASGEAAAPRAEADADAIRALRTALQLTQWSARNGDNEPVCPICRGDEYIGHGFACEIGRALKGTKLPGEQPGYTDNKALNERLAAENKRLRELATEILRVNQYAERYPITKAEGWRVLVDMTLAALKPEATKERK